MDDKEADLGRRMLAQRLEEKNDLPTQQRSKVMTGDSNVCTVCGTISYRTKSTPKTTFQNRKTCGDDACISEQLKRSSKARYNIIHAPRTCEICRKQFHIRPGEKGTDFRRRMACSERCKKKLLSKRNNSRKQR